MFFNPFPTKPTWWYVIQVAPRGSRIYEGSNLLESGEIEGIDLDTREDDGLEDVQCQDEDTTLEDISAREQDVAKECLEEIDVGNINNDMNVDLSLDGELEIDHQVLLDLH